MLWIAPEKSQWDGFGRVSDLHATSMFEWIILCACLKESLVPDFFLVPKRRQSPQEELTPPGNLAPWQWSLQGGWNGVSCNQKKHSSSKLEQQPIRLLSGSKVAPPGSRPGWATSRRWTIIKQYASYIIQNALVDYCLMVHLLMAAIKGYTVFYGAACTS